MFGNALSAAIDSRTVSNGSETRMQSIVSEVCLYLTAKAGVLL
jgi:hypothetical protein